MALFKKKVELNRFLHHTIATFVGGFPMAQVDPAYVLTAVNRIRAADILRVRSLVAHYFALVARVGEGIPVDAQELGRRYQDALWHVLVESTRSRVEAEVLAMQWERGVREVLTRTEDGSVQGSGSVLAEVSAATVRILKRALETDDDEYCRNAAGMVTEHAIQALSFALTQVKLVS